MVGVDDSIKLLSKLSSFETGSRVVVCAFSLNETENCDLFLVEAGKLVKPPCFS